MKTIFAICAIAVLLLSGFIVLAAPNQQAGDWCFEWDFTRGTYMWNVTAGAYNSIFGAYQMEVIDEEDEIWGIAASWTHERDVFANRIEIDMHRAYATVQEKYVAWYVNLFGINELGRVDLAAGENSYTMIVEPDSAGVGGPSINFAIQSDVPSGMLIDRMRVYGWGAAPFEAAPIFDELPLVECEALAITATPTLTLTPGASPTPTATQTPTETLTPTITLTPTLSGSWCYEWDLTSVDGGFTAPDGISTWASGTGWQGNYRDGNSLESLYITKSFAAAVITGVEITYTKTAGNGGNNVNRLYIQDGGTTVISSTTNQIGTNQIKGASGNATGDLVYIDINSGSLGATITVSRLKLWGAGTSPFGDNCSPTPTITPTATQTFTPSSTTVPMTATPTITPTREPTRTTNPNITPTVTNTSVFFFTPPPSTATPLPSATFIQPTLRPATYTPRPPPTEIPFATLPPPIQATLGTLPPPVTGTVTMTPTGTPTSIGGPGNGGDTIYGPGETERGIGGLFGAIIGVGQNGFTVARRYLEETIAILGQFTGAWQTAPVFPIEGLPQCATNRLASELCAIYYILTYTVLSGALGSVIMPAALVVLDMALLFSFLKLARAILARFAEITKV